MFWLAFKKKYVDLENFFFFVWFYFLLLLCCTKRIFALSGFQQGKKKTRTHEHTNKQRVKKNKGTTSGRVYMAKNPLFNFSFFLVEIYTTDLATNGC